jgi:hypothetical protein
MPAHAGERAWLMPSAIRTAMSDGIVPEFSREVRAYRVVLYALHCTTMHPGGGGGALMIPRAQRTHAPRGRPGTVIPGLGAAAR